MHVLSFPACDIINCSYFGKTGVAILNQDIWDSLVGKFGIPGVQGRWFWMLEQHGAPDAHMVFRNDRDAAIAMLLLG